MRAHALWLGLVAACGAASPTPEVTRATSYEGPLVDLVPGDVREVLVLRPSELLANQATRPLVDAIAPLAWRRALGDRTGVYAEDVSELVLCRWEDGAWWALVRVAHAADVVRAATPRMAPVEVATDEPFVRRIGYLADQRFELVALSSQLLLVAQGRPGDVVALLHALRDPRATAASEPRPLLRAETSSWLALPQPLSLPPDTPIGLLLSRQTGLRVEVASGTHRDDTPEAPNNSEATSRGESLHLSVHLEGEFPTGAEDNFRALLTSLAETDLGRVLGLPDALPTLQIARRQSGIELDADFEATTLSRGVHLLFRAEIVEIVGESGDAPSL